MLENTREEFERVRNLAWPAPPTDGLRELREELAEWLRSNLFWGLDPSKKLDAADAVLALPGIQRLIAAEEAVRRVRSMRDVATDGKVTVAAIDWALDGDIA